MKFLSFVRIIAFCGICLRSANGHGDGAKQENREMLSSIINIADKIQNAVPTVPTTPLPTVSPTISAAPSPRPSATPTHAPTISMAPSIAPTIAPTISAAPTNHPTISSAPSSRPSAAPTGVPSSSPTLAPTQAPTVSPAPSTSPSGSPTSSPTGIPSAPPTDVPSALPSQAPSDAPSVSPAPTLMYHETMRATTTIQLEAIKRKMNATQLEIFEDITKAFIQWNMQTTEGTTVFISSVTVLSQVLDVGAAHGRRLSHSGLEIDITTVGEYESLVHPDEFDFDMIIEQGFDSNFALFKSNLLDSGDDIFDPLDPTVITQARGDGSSNTNGLSRGEYIAVIVCSILAILLAAGVSYYAIRKAAEESKKGDKLSEMNMYNDPVGSNLTQESVGPSMKNTKSLEIIQVSDSPEKAQGSEEPESAQTQHEQSQDSTHRIQIETTPKATPSKEDYTEVINVDKIKPGTSREQVMSPNTMEAGRIGVLAESILRNESFGSGRDPPESSGRYGNYAGPKSKGDPSAKYRSEHYHNIPRPVTSQQVKKNVGFGEHDNSTQPKQRDPSVAGTSQFNNGKMLKSFFPKEPERRAEQQERTRLYQENFSSAEIKQQSSSQWLDKASQDVELTVGMNGKLGAAPIPNKNNTMHNKSNDQHSPSSSAVSSSINAFLNMVGGNMGTLGAAPLSSSPTAGQHEEKKEERNKNFHDVMQREGLYDVLAPSGALGIVVDTTKEGPAVHSLKQTSPMLGLINPGDLIVGLDSQDTRSMTAATLTRLMASKSHQKERKITLLAADNY